MILTVLVGDGGDNLDHALEILAAVAVLIIWAALILSAIVAAETAIKHQERTKVWRSSLNIERRSRYRRIRKA